MSTISMKKDSSCPMRLSYTSSSDWSMPSIMALTLLRSIETKGHVFEFGQAVREPVCCIVAHIFYSFTGDKILLLD